MACSWRRRHRRGGWRVDGVQRAQKSISPAPRPGHGHAVGVDLVHAPYTSKARVDDRLVHRERGGLLIIKIADVALDGVRVVVGRAPPVYTDR